MGDFRVKRITLPSGKQVEVVYFDQGLHVCRSCDSDLVYPVEWQELDGSWWWLELRCPECETRRKVRAPHEQVVEFDHLLNKGTDAQIALLEKVSRQNFERDISTFTAALHAGAVLPEDF